MSPPRRHAVHLRARAPVTVVPSHHLRRVLALLGLAVVLTLAAASSAGAYSGTSLDDNVSPESKADGLLADRWPSDRYGLDHHVGDVVKTGKPDLPLGGLPLGAPGIAADQLLGRAPKVPTSIDTDAAGASGKHTVAEALFDVTRWLAGLISTLLVWSLSLDLLSGTDGLLAPIADAGGRLYREISNGWMGAAVIALGAYILAFAVMRREIVQTLGKVIVSFLMVSFALLLLTQWQWTIGATSKYVNDASLAIIATVNGDDTRNAKVAASNALWDTLVSQPFMVLNFGGLEHCVDKDGKSVKPKSPACNGGTKIDKHRYGTTNGGTRIDNRKYLERWLDAGPPNSPARQLEYEAIRDAKIPDADRISDAGLAANYFAGYEVTRADTPAVDVQQRELAGDRLIVSSLIFIGTLGAGALIGGAAVAVIVFKILAVLLFGITALMAIAAMFPGAGHRTFWGWLERLVLALTLGLWYSLALALVLVMSRGIASTVPEFGWKLTYVILAVFWWSVFVLRKQFFQLVVRALPGSTGAGHSDRTAGDHARDWYYKSKMLLPAAAGVGAGIGAVIGRPDPEHGKKGGLIPRAYGQSKAGLAAARDLANDYAGKGHAERQHDTADLHGRALDELERDHQANIARHKDEDRNRARHDELAARQRAAQDDPIPDDVRRGMDLPVLSLNTRERREMRELERTRMPKKDYDALTGSINDIEQRRKDTGGQPFSTDQINARARLISQREEAQQDLAERTRRYTDYEYDDLFSEDWDGDGPTATQTRARDRQQHQARKRRRRERLRRGSLRHNGSD